MELGMSCMCGFFFFSYSISSGIQQIFEFLTWRWLFVPRAGDV